MKGFDFPYDGFKKGLRPHPTNPRNSEYCVELFNLMPAELGLEAHEEIQDITTTDIEWNGQGYYTPASVVRDLIIRVSDYVDDEELQTVSVYIDDVLKGTTDANGELVISNVLVGGHTLRFTKANYTDSEDDDLFNDYMFVI